MRTIRDSNASALVPARKSSNGVQSPRLFFEMSPSAGTSKCFLIVVMGVAAPRSCSNGAARGLPFQVKLTELISPLHVAQFKSRRQSERRFRGQVDSQPIDKLVRLVLEELMAAANYSRNLAKESDVRPTTLRSRNRET
jgi:hypothetical protein